MRILLGVMMLVVLCAGSDAEMREWTLRSGAIIQGEYETVAIDKIVLRDANGKRISLSFSEVSDADAAYVELENPPELLIDLLKSADQIFVKPSPIWVDNSPVNILRYTFGARVRQKNTADYTHDLTVEIYAVARQAYDPEKYHLVFKWKSEPFRLSIDNNRRCEIYATRNVELAEFRLSGEYPRGQEFAETVLVVRDERGEVVACKSTKNRFSENLDQLIALPEGAWFDKTCRRVHPTSPRPVWFD